MQTEIKGDFDDDKPSNPRIMSDYYISELDEVIDYERDGARGFILKFRILDDGVEVENDYNLEWSDGEIVLPFFAPGKLSVGKDGQQDSRLSENLMELGLHGAVLQVLDEEVRVKTGEDESGDPVFEDMMLSEAVSSGRIKAVAGSEAEADELKHAVEAVVAGKQIRVNVSEDDSGESQVSELDRVWEESDDGSESNDSTGEKDKLFDDNKEEQGKE